LPAKVNGLKIERKFTEAGKDPFQKLNWTQRDVEIRNFDGTVAFSMKGVNLPDNYSQVAANVLSEGWQALGLTGVGSMVILELKGMLRLTMMKCVSCLLHRELPLILLNGSIQV
jgi:hypothetical protein